METKYLLHNSTQKVKLHYFSYFFQQCLSKVIWANILKKKNPSAQVFHKLCMGPSKTWEHWGIAITLSAACGGSLAGATPLFIWHSSHLQPSTFSASAFTLVYNRRGRKFYDFSTSSAWTEHLIWAHRQPHAEWPHATQQLLTQRQQSALLGSTSLCLPLLDWALAISNMNYCSARPLPPPQQQPPPSLFSLVFFYSTAPSSLEAALWQQKSK